MVKQRDIEINVLHTLENFRDAYDDEASVVVLEAMANALDAKANMVDITLKNQSITFRDNGPGMTQKDFKAYHKISGSNKEKGHGIGFAGVGAKVYLAIWKNTIIHTETFGDDGAFASDMHVTRGCPKWDECDTASSMKTRGTSYGVKLRKKDYEKLQSKLQDIIRDDFNPAMLTGLSVIINGTRLEPWDPPHKTRIIGVAKAKNVKFPIILSVMDDDVPSKYRHIQYHVWGKTVSTKKPDWKVDISEPYRNRVHVTVNAEKCSSYLKFNKNSFKNGSKPVADMYECVNVWVTKTLRKAGYMESQTGQVKHNVKLSNFFKELFQKSEYKWLDPNTTSGIGSGSGTGTGTTKTPTTEPHGNGTREKQNENTTKKRGGSGLNITLVDRYNDQRDGWLDPETNNFVCNKQHPLYHKYEKNEEARNQRVKSIMFSALIKHGAGKQEIATSEAFDIHRDLMTQAKDIKVV